MVALDPNFKEFLNTLELHHVEYVLIGGYAVNYHGYVRYTGDMDVFVSDLPENAARVAKALQDFGFHEVTTEMFATPSSMVRMGISPTKLEVTNFIDGISFEQCYKNRLRVVVDGLEINIISLADLRQNKKISGRTKDLADLENLPEH